MRSDSFLYKYYYQWWKNIDKSIFFIISLLFIIGLFFSLVSNILKKSFRVCSGPELLFFPTQTKMLSAENWCPRSSIAQTGV
mgnify:CR=1 FL=1